MSKPSNAKPWPLYALLAGSLALNAVLLFSRGAQDQPDKAATLEEPDAESVAVTGDTAGQAAPGAPDAPDAMASQVDGWTVVRGNVEQSLARTFQIEAGEAGDALSSVYTRLFVWDLDLRRDLQAGDAVAVAWRTAPDGLPEIAAASLQSQKKGQTMVAYRWQVPGDLFPSYWRLDGNEVPLRLGESPLEQYEQITSLLKDRPTHKGMDFKTPVGTEVRAPRAGTVTRANWNWNANGNCLEIRYDDGVLAKFLHLSENRVEAGTKVSAGQVIALSGNTGHSTAPHLHYQIDRGGKTLDPLDYHGTVRRTLTADQTAALNRDTASFQGILAEPPPQ